MRSLLSSERRFTLTDEFAAEIGRFDQTDLVERFSYAGVGEGSILVTPTISRYWTPDGAPLVLVGAEEGVEGFPLLQDRLFIRDGGVEGVAELLVVDAAATEDRPGQLRKYDVINLGTIEEQVVLAWENEFPLGQRLHMTIDHPAGWVKIIDPGFVIVPHPRVDEIVMQEFNDAHATEFATPSKVVWAVMSYHNQQRGAAS